MSDLVVAAAIVDDLRRPTTLLAARRSAPAEMAGAWELPGGKVEPGETPVAALRRELAEELGVTVHLGQQLRHPTLNAWPLTEGLRMHVWWAVVTENQPEPRQDHDMLRLLGPGQWRSVSWLLPDVPIITAAEHDAAPQARRPIS